MKRLILLIVLLLPVLFSCNKRITPASYNDTIVSLQIEIQAQLTTLEHALDAKDKDRVNGAIEQTTAVIDSAIARLDELGPYKGDDTMRQVAYKLFNLYRHYVVEYFREIATMKMKDPSNITDEEISAVKSLDTKLHAEQTKLDHAFEQAQHDFALKHNLIIEEAH